MAYKHAIAFSPKVWFRILGNINAQNYHTWSTTKPHVYRKSSLHALKVGVCYRMFFQQKWKAADSSRRLRCANWMLNFIREYGAQTYDHIFSENVFSHIGKHYCTELPYVEYNKATCLSQVIAAFTEGRCLISSWSGQNYWPNFFSVRLYTMLNINASLRISLWTYQARSTDTCSKVKPEHTHQQRRCLSYKNFLQQTHFPVTLVTTVTRGKAKNQSGKANAGTKGSEAGAGKTEVNATCVRKAVKPYHPMTMKVLQINLYKYKAACHLLCKMLQKV